MKNPSTTKNQQLPTSEGIVAKPSDYKELEKHRKEVFNLEQERQFSKIFRFYTGWILAGVFCLFAVIESIRSLTWGHPQDHFQIAILHEDGTYSAPTDIKNLTPVQQREILETSLINYITYREYYTYTSSQKSYDIISAMTVGKEQERYQKHMLDQNDTENPLIKYAEHGIVTPIDIRLDPDPNSENSWNFSFTRRVTDNDNSTTVDTPMRGILTFTKGQVLTKFKIPYDPANIVILQYESHEVSTK